MKHWLMLDGVSTVQNKSIEDVGWCVVRLVRGQTRSWGREGERGFVVASGGGWVCACVCVGGGA
jgi:hypothetical protein